MSEENVEVIRHMLEAWNRGDYEHAEEAFDPDVVAEMAGGTPLDGTYRGLPAFAAAMWKFWGTFADFRSEVEEFKSTGNTVFATVHHYGRGRSSGVSVEQRNWQVFTVRDRKIVRYRIFGTREEALEAAGLSK